MKIGFSTVPHKPCYIIKKKVLIFFYINNIVFIFEKKIERG